VITNIAIEKKYAKEIVLLELQLFHEDFMDYVLQINYNDLVHKGSDVYTFDMARAEFRKGQ
jgi:hypothetical protein